MTERVPPGVWDERYAVEDYLFGVEPNDFLKASVDQLPRGKTLCLADGEGRNGVWLAGKGHEVTSVDASKTGLEKAASLANAQAVTLKTELADLFEWDMGDACWDSIVSVFFHMPPAHRAEVHARAARALRPGGVLLLEAYTPKQLEFRTGGPPFADFLMTAEILKQDFAGLDILHLLETEREVVEGTGHVGHAAVVQLIARRG